MVQSSTKHRESGQAMAEFVVCAAVVALIFGGIVFFGKFGIASFSTTIAARNNALLGRGAQSWKSNEEYIKSNAEIYRFSRDYGQKMGARGLATICAVSRIRQQNHMASSYFSVDKFLGRDDIAKRPSAKVLVRKNLFGETDGPSR